MKGRSRLRLRALALLLAVLLLKRWVRLFGPNGRRVPHSWAHPAAFLLLADPQRLELKPELELNTCRASRRLRVAPAAF